MTSQKPRHLQRIQSGIFHVKSVGVSLCCGCSAGRATLLQEAGHCTVAPAKVYVLLARGEVMPYHASGIFWLSRSRCDLWFLHVSLHVALCLLVIFWGGSWAR